jgi:acyl-CoA thioesterase-2
VTGTSTPDIAAYLAVEPLGDDRFRAAAERRSEEPFGGMFGGHPLALGLRAAGATVEANRLVHSLHGYFLRAGDSRQPLDIEVERDADGRSFSSRRVLVRQAGRPIFTMAVSFHVGEEGPDQQIREMPSDARDPDQLAAWSGGRGPSSILEVSNAGSRYDDGDPSRAWARAAGPLPEDPLLHACVLVHFSDLYSGLPAIPGTSDHGGPSLDHAFWFHRPARLDEWIFMDLEPVTSSRGRGLYTGSFYDRRGVLVASLAQEMLFSTSRSPRQRPPWTASDASA